jgi:hypothetical protein
MAGLTGTLIMTVCVMLAFANAAAVSVTVKAVVTVAGAVYVTLAVVEFDSVPQLLTGQLVRLHRTPAFNGPPVTVAVKFAESPGSIVSLPGPVIVTPVGLLLPPPQPLRAGIISPRRRAMETEKALLVMRRRVTVCFPGRVRKAGLY